MATDQSAIGNCQSAISSLPIGIFDSGVGGLTVYRALHERLPNERFVYLGDTARVPYGTKSLATVQRYAVENSKFLEDHGIKLLVVACNTASALALNAIRETMKVQVVGVIDPGARAAVEMSNRKKIAVIATEERPKYMVRRYIFCQSRSVSSGFSPSNNCLKPQAMEWL